MMIKTFLLIVSLLISVTGMMFKTTVDRRKSGVKRINRFGWMLLCLLIISLTFSIYVNHTDDLKSQEQARNQTIKDSLTKKIDSIRDAHSEQYWQYSLQKNRELINRLRTDSVRDAKFQSLQKKYIDRSEKDNKLLANEVNDLNFDLARLRNPIDTVKIALAFSIAFKGSAKRQFDSLFVAKVFQSTERKYDLEIDKDLSDLLFSESFMIDLNTDAPLKKHRIWFHIGANNFMHDLRSAVDLDENRQYSIGGYNQKSGALIIQVNNIMAERNTYASLLSFSELCKAKISAFPSVSGHPGKFDFNLLAVRIYAKGEEDFVEFHSLKNTNPGDNQNFTGTCDWCAVR